MFCTQFCILQYGFPEEIVGDNGSQVTAAVFRNFLSRNEIKQTLVPHHHTTGIQWCCKTICTSFKKKPREASDSK